MAFSASFSNISETSAKFSASYTGGDSSYSRYRYVRLTIDGDEYEIRSSSKGGSSSSFSKTITGLSAGTKYSWTAELGYDPGDGTTTYTSTSKSGSFTTDEVEIVFDCDFSNITETTAYFYASFSGNDTNYWRFVRLYYKDESGNSKEIIIQSDSKGGTTSSFGKTISGLTAGTSYTWGARIGYGSSSSSVSWSDTTTDSGSFMTKAISIDPWSWTASNGSATAAQTKTAYNILMGTVTVDTGFSHLVWNDLVDKVAEMRAAKNYSWDTANGTYPTQSGCKVTSNENLSAKKYNGIRYNIGSVKSTGISDQSAGGNITGYKIYHLTEVLNEIINAL